MVEVKVAEIDDIFDMASELAMKFNEKRYVISEHAVLETLCKEYDEGHQVFVAESGGKRIGIVKGYISGRDYVLKNRILLDGQPIEALDPQFLSAAVDYARQAGLERVCLEWDGSCVETLCRSGLGRVIGGQVAIPIGPYPQTY
jgi:hypothetical protein